MMNLQWEQVSLYPAGIFTRYIPVQLDVTLPDGWTGAAALDGLKVAGNRYSYAPTSYETLVDSPMFAGKYFRKWDLGQNVTLNVVADEAQYLEAKPDQIARRSEEHTSELQSLMRISYAVFCLKKNKQNTYIIRTTI